MFVALLGGRATLANLKNDTILHGFLCWREMEKTFLSKQHQCDVCESTVSKSDRHQNRFLISDQYAASFWIKCQCSEQQTVGFDYIYWVVRNKMKKTNIFLHVCMISPFAQELTDSEVPREDVQQMYDIQVRTLCTY